MVKVTVTHIITGLNMGGAETMLYKLLKNIDKTKFDLKVISMLDEGVYGEKIRKLGINVISLNIKRGSSIIKGFKQAKKEIKNTDIIQTWMYHADLFGYLLYRTLKVKKLIWGIRRNNLDAKINKKSTLIIAKINSILSRKVDVVVSCSLRAKETHTDFGFNNENMVVIPNGFEMERFNLVENNKRKLSNLISKPITLPFIVHVGRWNVLKDHKNFLKALKSIKDDNINFHAIMIGPNINENNYDLVNLIQNYNINENVSLLDQQDDIPFFMSSADLFVSSSLDEGFPNVIGEAMACGTPCVVTDAGDSAYIVGNTGVVVPPNDSGSLAKGITEMLSYDSEGRRKIGLQARQRILDNFDIKNIANQYENLYNI